MRYIALTIRTFNKHCSCKLTNYNLSKSTIGTKSYELELSASLSSCEFSDNIFYIRAHVWSYYNSLVSASSLLKLFTLLTPPSIIQAAEAMLVCAIRYIRLYVYELCCLQKTMTSKTSEQKMKIYKLMKKVDNGESQLTFKQISITILSRSVNQFDPEIAYAVSRLQYLSLYSSHQGV